MKSVRAQFKPAWRPGRATVVIVAILALGAIGSVATAGWLRWRVSLLKQEISNLEAQRLPDFQPPPSPLPTYATSAEMMLRQRAAPWASMLRTLESAAVIGVTPVHVEFDAMSGIGRVDLTYKDPVALFEYLKQINEGMASGGAPPWRLVQAHAPTGGRMGGNGLGPQSSADQPGGAATASIQFN